MPDELYELILRQKELEAEATPQFNITASAAREKLALNIAGNVAMSRMALAAELAEALSAARGRLFFLHGRGKPEDYHMRCADCRVLEILNEALSHARAEGIIK